VAHLGGGKPVGVHRRSHDVAPSSLQRLTRCPLSVPAVKPKPARARTEAGMCRSARLQLDFDPRVVSQQLQLHDRPHLRRAHRRVWRSDRAPLRSLHGVGPLGRIELGVPGVGPHGSEWFRELSRSGRSGGRSGSLFHIDRGAAPHSIDEQVTDDPQFTQRRRNREGIRQRLRLRQQIADKCTQ